MEHEEIPAEAKDLLKDPNLIREQLEGGKTFQEILGYDAEKMEKFYQAAYALFHRQEYEKCAEAFIFLTTLNPYIHNYWLGLGMAEQLRARFHEALLAHAMAILTDMENPVPHYQSANCYRMIGDLGSATASFEMAIACCGEKSEFLSLKAQAEKAREKTNR